MGSKSVLYPDELQHINNTIFKPCYLDLQNLNKEAESAEYLAYQFELNGKNVVFRKAKITPTKAGQFVTIWKRNEDGITAPFDVKDNFECFIIYTETENERGFYLFPKDVLLANKIISGNASKGKRGIRVYPPWNTGLNKQAERTQGWQNNYFVNLTSDAKIDFGQVSKLLKFLKVTQIGVR